MKGVIAGLVIVVLIAAGVFLMQERSDHITLSAGKAVPMGDGGMFMATLDIANDGPADQLLSVSSPSAVEVSVMNPNMMDAPLIVPGGQGAQLAMDGAHLVLRTEEDTFPEGGFLPITLTFAKAGQVTARLQNSGASTMDHNAPGVLDTPAPVITLSWAEGPGATASVVQITTKNMTFVQVDEDAAHVPGEGHAHAYLNGLKLGRVYSDRFALGALMPGDYVLAVSLNTHDHRPYLDDGEPVRQTLEFRIPK